MIPSLAYALLFFVAGGSAHQAVRRISLAVAIAGSAVAAWTLIHRSVSEFGNDPGVLDFAAAYAGSAIVVVGGWTYGFTRYQRRTVEEARVAETIAELERRRLLELYDEQAERSRLARDMHDVVAHSLAVVIAQAEGARFALASSPDDAAAALGVIAGTAREALGEVRGVLQELRSGDTAAQATAHDRTRLFERMRAAGMTLATEQLGDPANADAAVAATVHRILTEALTNALKHGDLSEPVIVVDDWRDGAALTVRNAVPAEPHRAIGAGHGILGMTERAATVGGTVRSAAAGDHWVLELSVPTPKGPRP
ncbi:sensor histidine kinase [Gordonia sp. (in: high G+C Gram-positive bacteria)]|uniref:sensor histidine kinase n=1 Tax=Gordonia sp. (in: high G+C Gram-positive bacteria) TaxID=84139 RepID=UPI0035295BAE